MECFLPREECLSTQLGRSRERQLERLDFLDSIDILIESWLFLILLSIKNEMSEFVIINTIYLIIPNQNDQIPPAAIILTKDKILTKNYSKNKK